MIASLLAGGKLREVTVKRNSPSTDKYSDSDMSFVLVEIANHQMYFQVVSRTRETVDTGILANQKKQK